MLNALIRNLIIGLLRLRYRIRIDGREQVARRGRSGILFLPNHPALIDPVIVMAALHKRFAPRPLGVETQVNRPGIRWFTRRVGVLPVPDLTERGASGTEQVQAVVEACVAALRRGENILLYPAGHLYRSRHEDLRGNSAVELILRQAPQARVVLIRSRGLWGSSFSYHSGQVPVFWRAVKRAIPRLLANFVFFTPRRDVTLELHEPDDFPRDADRRTMNEYMEAFYNEDAPAALYVPYTIWERGGRREMPDPQFGRVEGQVAQVPESTRRMVLDHLRQLTETEHIEPGHHLAKDLGLDSLARAELVLWLGQEFGFHGADVDVLQTVGDVMLAARGQALASRPVELKPAPPAWFRGIPDEPIDIPDVRTINAAFLAQARRAPRRVAVADQRSGAKTYRDLITGIFALAPAIERLAGAQATRGAGGSAGGVAGDAADGDAAGADAAGADAAGAAAAEAAADSASPQAKLGGAGSIGIMLPASVAADLAYLAVLFTGRTPVMVNWTTGARNILHGLELTDTRHVLTARELIGRLEGQGLDVGAFRDRLVFMEDLARSLKLPAKLLAALRARLRWRALDRVRPSDTAAVLFTSGSEAKPKAVPLSHANILANARDVVQIVNIRRTDSMVGFLPPFHSFGLSVNMILPLAAGLRVVHHANPTEGWVIAPLVEAYQATLLVGTPTFLAGIARVARPGQLDSVKLAVTGAEKCSESTYALLAEKCPNAVVIEGYGVTECSPIVSANRPEAPQAGTIGPPLPSIEHAVVDVETNQRAAPGQPGMLLVRGPSVFSGYLGDAPTEPFTEFEGKTWYRTGDLVTEAADGTLTFSGRLKRFVKLGGEMISLPAIEAVLAERAGAADDEGPVLAVEATPSEDHPEIVLFTTREIDRATANRWIREAGLSPLHNVSRVERLEEIPLLGTGKTNYRALKERLA